MSVNIKIQKNVRIDWAPLAPSASIEVVGAVPPSQDYCVDSGLFVPDYTLAGLTLQPRVTVVCADGSYPSGYANAALDNIKWYSVEGGVRTQVLATDAGYDMSEGATGTANAGRLIVTRNSAPNTPWTLQFEAILYDSRLNQTIDISASIAIRCTNSSAPPRLKLDIPTKTIYNPLRDRDSVTIKAHLMIGKAIPAANQRLFSWEVYDDIMGSAQWRAIGTDVLDYWAVASDDTLTVNRKIMRYKQRLRCRAVYDYAGNPSLSSLCDSSPTAEFGIERVLRGIGGKVVLSRMATADTTALGAALQINDNRGMLGKRTYVASGSAEETEQNAEIAKIDDIFDVQWLAVKNAATLNNPTYSMVARGAVASIPTDKIDSRYGMQVECKVDDRGPLLPWADSDGKILTDSDGKILLIK